MDTFTTRMPPMRPSGAIDELPLLAAGPFGWFRGVLKRFEERRRREAEEAILQGLDNRTLRDIGFDRSEIKSLVYGAGEDMTRVDRDA